MQRERYGDGRAWIGIFGLLMCSYLLVAGLSVGVFILWQSYGLAQGWGLCLALATGAVLGLLVSGHIAYNLALLEHVLVRVVARVAVKLESGWRRWPFGTLFTALHTLSRRTDADEHVDLLGGEENEQLLRQAREAAALAERNRIARDLHDSIKQQIFSISISAAAAKAHTREHAEDALEAIADIQQSAKEAQVEMQALLQQLRAAPLESTNLPEALLTQAQALAYRSGVEMHLDLGDLPPSDRLLPGTQEAIFRVIQEVFANISRHARAQNVWLTLSLRDDLWHIAVRDDGQGFDMQTVHRGMGLANLHERMVALRGTVTIESLPGQGTKISAAVPLLATAQTLQEQTRSAHLVQMASEQAKWNQQSGELVALAGLALAFYLSPFSLGVINVCLLSAGLLVVMGYVWLQSRRAIAIVVAHRGAISTAALALNLRQLALGSSLLQIFMVECWYIFIVLHGWSYPFAVGIPITFNLMVVLIIRRVRQSRQHLQDSYYHLLPEAELGWALAQRRQVLISRTRLYAVVGGIALLVNIRNIEFIFPPSTTANWITYGATVGILIWIERIITDFRQIARWEMSLARSNAKHVAVRIE